MDPNSITQNMNSNMINQYFRTRVSTHLSLFFSDYAFQRCVKDFSKHDVTQTEEKCFNEVFRDIQKALGAMK